MNNRRTLLDLVYGFMYPLTSERLSMVLWRELMRRNLKKGGKYARAALEVLYLLQK